MKSVEVRIPTGSHSSSMMAIDLISSSSIAFAIDVSDVSGSTVNAGVVMTSATIVSVIASSVSPSSEKMSLPAIYEPTGGRDVRDSISDSSQTDKQLGLGI